MYVLWSTYNLLPTQNHVSLNPHYVFYKTNQLGKHWTINANVVGLIYKPKSDLIGAYKILSTKSAVTLTPTSLYRLKNVGQTSLFILGGQVMGYRREVEHVNQDTYPPCTD